MSNRTLYTIYGALFGLCFPIIATLMRFGFSTLSGNVCENILTCQRTDPLLWIIDTAPFFLGLFARFAGVRQDKVEAYSKTLEQKVIERTKDIATILDHMQAAIFAIGPDLKISQYQSAFTARLYNRSDLAQKHFPSVIYPGSPEKAAQAAELLSLFYK